MLRNESKVHLQGPELVSIMEHGVQNACLGDLGNPVLQTEMFPKTLTTAQVKLKTTRNTVFFIEKLCSVQSFRCFSLPQIVT